MRTGVSEFRSLKLRQEGQRSGEQAASTGNQTVPFFSAPPWALYLSLARQIATRHVPM